MPMPKKLEVRCRDCGRTPEETKFYESRTDRCSSCINSRNKARKVTPKPEETTMLAERVSTKKLPYLCPIHGPHDGTVNGRSRVEECPACFKAKQIAGLKNYHANLKATQDALDSCPFVLPWLKEQAGAGDGDLTAALVLMVRRIAEDIPPEWVKTWIMRGGLK